LLCCTLPHALGAVRGHYRAYCHTQPHTTARCRAHCRSQPCALPHTSHTSSRAHCCTLLHTAAHCGTLPHCRTAAQRYRALYR
jgi:hypothetical protein